VSACERWRRALASSRAVSRLAGSSSRTCGIRDDGALACWGNGELGRLADGVPDEPHTTPSPTRARRGSTGEYVADALQVVAGDTHSCLLNRDHQVECWGDNSQGQLGTGGDVERTATTQLIPNLDGVEALAAGASHTCALRSGEVWCWGANDDAQLGFEGSSPGVPTQIRNLTGVSSIASGAYHVCALRFDGTLFCWGNNFGDQLGTKQVPQQAIPTPTRVEIEPVQSVFAGSTALHTCAITRSGRAFCWGSNELGELGRGETTHVSEPLPGVVTVLEGSVLCE